MTFQRPEVKGKKTKIGDDDGNHEVRGAVFHEDMLLEIFIRLPDCRSALCIGIVCHNWHSLISHNPQFIPRFISHHHQHHDRYPLSPFAIFFRKADNKNQFASAQDFQPICKLFSKDPKSGITSTNYLDFLPSPMVIRGSCNDLMLVSPGPRWLTPHYICNPITKQFYLLPESPKTRRTQVIGHALVCMPGHTNQFKVAEFHHPRHLDLRPELPPHYTRQPMSIFCSKSRKWEVRCFRYPQPRRLWASSSLHAVSCNGILFWLEFESRVDRVICLDLTSEHSKCGVIAFPDDSYYDPHFVKEQIGVVRVRGGEFELRLIQVVLSLCMESISHLKVWKLKKDNKDWVLVHHKKKLKMLKREQKHQFVAPFVHPTNGDVVFMVWGTSVVFQFNLKESVTTYEMIDKLQEPLVTNTGSLQYMDRLLSFPIVHPTWPTLLRANLIEDDEVV